MIVAIDKDTINRIQDFPQYEYVYVFDDTEKAQDLFNMDIHCIHKDYALDIDINLTRFDLNCLKRASIDDAEWYKLPSKKDYKYAIIVPNYNNDHRRIQR